MGLLRILGVIFSPAISLAGMALRPIFEPLFDRYGISNPIDRKRRVDNHGRKVEQLITLKEVLMRGNPHPSSEQARTWLDEVEKLEKDGANIKFGFEEAGYKFWKSWYYARVASKDSIIADGLINRYKDISQDSKRPGLFRDVQLGGPVVEGPYMTKLACFITGDTSQSGGVLGIWGMAGVGKTTLLKSLYNCRWTYDAFHVLFVPAGRKCTAAELQLSIAKLLGLPATSQEALSYEINEYLLDKNFILLLDDMWDSIDLVNVGIPLPFGTVNVMRKSWLHAKIVQRRLILASRRHAVCTLMNCCKNTLHMLCPSEQEASKLFTDMIDKEAMKVGRINTLSRQIIDECERLPLALCKIGRAMSAKDDPEEWRQTLQGLRESKLNEITLTGDLLECLTLSYDHLERDLQPCFLICSLWCESELIPLDKLIKWWIGLGLLGGSDAGAYWRGLNTVRDLLDSSLFENANNSLFCTEHSHIRLHKMMRHMAVLTVKNILQESWVSFSSSRPAIAREKWYNVRKAWLSPVDTAPWLSSYYSQQEAQLTMVVSRHTFPLRPAALFKNVLFLDMEGTEINTFPLEICAMHNLEYLNLSSTKVNALPMELRRLSKLKYLHLRAIMSLNVPDGLISGLKELQELDVFHTVISSLLSELQRSDVVLGMLGLTVSKESEIQELARLSHVSPVSICLRGLEAPSINLEEVSEMNQLRELSIVKCSADKVVSESMHEVLPNLLFFEIRDLANLKSISFVNTGLGIRTIHLSWCKNLTDATWLDQLVGLEELRIGYCKMMKTLFTAVSRNIDGVHFPKLKKIHLQDLPELSTISERPLHLDTISYFLVVRCSNLRHQQRNLAWWNLVEVTEEASEDMCSRFTREE